MPGGGARCGSRQPTRSVIPLFSDFTQDEFNAFTGRMTIHTIAAGKPVINEGDKGSSVFVLTRGSVKVFSTIKGKKMELADLQSGDFFGEIAFLTGKPRTATIVTVEESDVLEVAEDDLNEMINKSPRIREVLHNYHEQRVKSTLEKVKDAL